MSFTQKKTEVNIINNTHHNLLGLVSLGLIGFSENENKELEEINRQLGISNEKTINEVEKDKLIRKGASKPLNIPVKKVDFTDQFKNKNNSNQSK